ncbi:MAG: FHA domain-containing protein [Elusimicrobiota bacterium]|nr:FHA domain-containing protein [Elusimicrobiota bacterium]
MDRILVQKDEETLQEYPLDKERIRIGRDPGNDIAFCGEIDISKNHAEVLRGPSGGKIVDLGSFSGTYVNGERIKERELRNGDKITIGDYTLICLCEAVSGEAKDSVAAAVIPEVPPEAEAPAPEIIPAEPAPEPAAVEDDSFAASSTLIIPPEAENPAPEAIPAEPAPEPAAAEMDDSFAASSTLIIPPEAEAPAPEIIPAEPAPEPAAAAEDDSFAASSTLIIPPEAETPAPETIPAEPAPEPAAAESDDSFAATIMKAPPAETPTAEINPAEPGPGPAAAEKDDRFEATSILKAPLKEEEPVPEEIIPAEPEPPAAEKEDVYAAAPAAVHAAAPPGTSDRFAITSILKVPRKIKPAPGAAPAAPDMEEGVIEIEVQETPFWSKKRLTKAAVLAGAAGCAIFGMAVLRSADFRSLLTPSSQISFNIVPDDAQVYVNGAEMPKPGSGVLRNLPAGRFSVKVLHSSYPAARTMDIETGLFKRRVVVESAPGGISTK